MATTATAALDLAQRFSENLLRLRQERNLSQEELGLRASLHRTEISQLERGLRLARLDTVIKLAGGLEVQPGELLTGMSWTSGEVRPGNFAFRGDAEPASLARSLDEGPP